MASVPGGGTLLNPLFQVVSFGAGTAMAPALRPVLQDLENTTWGFHAVRPLAVKDAALASIKGFSTSLDLAAEAAKSGYGTAVFGALEQNLREYPGTAELLELWRRDRLGRGDVDLALQRAGIPEPYRTAVL